MQKLHPPADGRFFQRYVKSLSIISKYVSGTSSGQLPGSVLRSRDAL